MKTPKLGVKVSALETVSFDSVGSKVELSVAVAGVVVFKKMLDANVTQAIADAAHCHAVAAKANEWTA